MSEPLFARIADDLHHHGYSISRDALPPTLCRELGAQAASDAAFHQAGIGRGQQHTQNNNIRRDHIRWINGDNDAEQQWLVFTDNLKLFLNRQLFLGLSFYESHFARYPVDAFYRKHRDAFQGNSNRVLSTVLYLNDDWQTEDGGELLLYNDNDQLITAVTPHSGTLLVFLSEEFPHEVKPANRERYSIAGWFRNKQP